MNFEPSAFSASSTIQFSSVQSLSHVRLFVTPRTEARQASLSITNSRSSPRLMFIESVMPSNNLILCHPLLFLPSIFPSIRVFSNESALPIRWPKYWSFSFNISPSNEHPGLISFRIDWLDHLEVQGVTYVFSNFRASYKFQNHQNRPSCFTDEETGRQSCVRIVSKMLSSSCVLDGCQICLSKVNSQQIASLLEIFQMAIPHQMTADCTPSTQPCPFWLLLMPLPNVPLTGLLCG